MLVTLTNTDTITVDLPVDSLSWAVTSAGELGQARFTIPRNSPAFSAAYFDEDGGSLVRFSHGQLGDWPGLIDGDMTIDGTGAVIQAGHMTALAGIRTLAVSRTFRAITAGAIARVAVMDALSGLGKLVMQPGTFVEAAPIIPEFTFTGQYLTEVLNTLAELSGQEWVISNTGLISWLPRQGSLYAPWLAEPSALSAGSRTANPRERVSEYIVRDGLGRAYSAYNNDLAAGSFYQRQVVASVSSVSPAVAGNEAERGVGIRQASPVTYSFGLLRPYWSAVREGDYLRVVLPHAGIRCKCELVRVLKREYSSAAGDVLGLTVQRIEPFTASMSLRYIADAGPMPAPTVTIPQASDPVAVVGIMKDDLAGLNVKVNELIAKG